MKFKLALKFFLVSLLAFVLLMVSDVALLNLALAIVGGVCFLVSVALSVGVKNFLLLLAVYGGFVVLYLLALFLK